jgi:hypothetical protein
MHNIFSKLGFSDKISAGLVCNHWDRLLKTGTAASRHWVVDYNVDTIDPSTACPSNKGPIAEKFIIIKRCATFVASPVAGNNTDLTHCVFKGCIYLYSPKPMVAVCLSPIPSSSTPY